MSLIRVNSRVRTLSIPAVSRPLVILACLGFIAAVAFRESYPGFGPNGQSYDFGLFYSAALAVRHGANPFLQAAAWAGSYVPGATLRSFYVYSPLFAILLIPFTVLPQGSALFLWEFCNVVFLIGAIYGLLRAFGNRSSFTVALILADAAAITHPIRGQFYSAQSDLFLLFLVSTALWLRQANRRELAGILLAVACVTKPALLVILVVLLWKREFRFALVAGLASIVFLIGPFLWLGAAAWHDQLLVWNFWSHQYVSFWDNFAPKGLLARLLTVNPFTRPVVVAPQVVTAIWLMIAATVVLLTAAVVSTKPLQRDARSLAEIGLVICAMFLISPLSEGEEMALLLLPLVALYVWLRNAGWRSPSYRGVLVCGIGVWLMLCMPLEVSHRLLNASQAHPGLSAPLIIVGAIFLYVVVALFSVLLSVCRRTSGRPLLVAVLQLAGNLPAEGRAWLRDAGQAIRNPAQ